MERRWRRLALVPPVTAVVAGAALQHLGRTWGSTAAERRAPMPGDEIVARPDVRTTHAISIAAPADEVWPWLVQMGYHRGGWYTYEWVDRLLFRMDNPSADHIVPELQPIAVGDIIPDGEPGTAWYVVDEVETAHHLVLHSTTHDAPWRGRRGVWVNWTWTYLLLPTAGGGTRLVVRVRIAAGPWWLRAIVVGGIVPADFVMSRSQLRGIRGRAERARRLVGASA